MIRTEVSVSKKDMCFRQGLTSETKRCVYFLYFVATYSMVGFVVACSREERLGKTQRHVTINRAKFAQSSQSVAAAATELSSAREFLDMN